MEDEIKGRKLKSVEELYADMPDVPKEFITTLSPMKSLCFDCPIWKN